MDEDIEHETLFGNEYSAKDRCQQLGIQIENARRGSGPDRFKYLCLIAFLYLRQQDNDYFDNYALEQFFQIVIPRLGNIRVKNSLCCVIAAFITLEYEPTLKYTISKERFDYFQKQIFPKNETFFKKNGVGVMDVVRYIRYMSKIPMLV